MTKTSNVLRKWRHSFWDGGKGRAGFTIGSRAVLLSVASLKTKPTRHDVRERGKENFTREDQYMYIIYIHVLDCIWMRNSNIARQSEIRIAAVRRLVCLFRHSYLLLATVVALAQTCWACNITKRVRPAAAAARWASMTSQMPYVTQRITPPSSTVHWIHSLMQ